MTRKPVRSKVAVATTALGVAVLLAGPMNTFGLGVPSTGDVAGTTTQVTSTVQGVVDTTQQTAATTVTNVESTAQTTVQTTTQAVAPQPTSTTQPQTSAPTVTKQVTTRAATPGKKQVSAVSRPRTQGKPAAVPVQLAKSAGGASSEQVSVADVAKRTHVARTRHVTAPALTTTSPRAQDAPVDCAVPALALLPGGSELQALLNVVCDAAGGIDLPARLGLAHTDTGTPAPLGDARPASARGTSGPVVARSSSLGTHPSAAGGARQATGGGSNVVVGGQPAGGPIGVGGGRGMGVAHVGAVPMAHISPASGAASHASASSGHHHHAFFSGQSRGAEILMAIIFANLAILAGIALWRLAVRWVIPRFA